MKYCKQCKIQILDQTSVCPFCRSVLEKEDEEQTEPMYPQVSIPQKKYRFLMRISLFVSVITMLLLGVINYLTYAGLMWSVICDAGILYFLLTLRYTLFNQDEGHTMKIMVQSLAAILLCILIDHILGYRGWSVNYAIPCAILLVDTGIIVLMIVNMQNWQSYILLQLGMIVIAGIQMILVTRPLLSLIALVSSGVLFLGTVLLGDRRAKNELKRRFHI